MSDLIYPTLDVFAYNLAEGLGDNPEDIKKRRDSVLANLPKTLQDDLNPAFDKESTAGNPDYIELLKLAGAKTPFQEFATTLNNYALKGYYYPVRLSDTYGLLFDCSVDEKIQPQDVSCLRYLKQQADSLPSDLGKTWLVSGSLPTSNPDPELLAKNIYKNLLAPEKSQNLTDAAYEALINQEWHYRKTGKFLTASVFEIWQTPHKWQNVAENIHILIFLYPDQKTMENAAQFYEDWMRLLCYRNKIIWAYCETQKLKHQLQAGFKTIRETIPIVQNKAELSQLKATLKRNVETFSNYAINLNYLEIQRSTLEVNYHNYQEYIKHIKNYIHTNANKFGDTDLKFLEEFSTIIQQKYQEQVKKDYESLRPGIDILENQLNTIRGIVEIEQAERDRRIETQNTKFQNAVAGVGVGLGIAALAASAVSPFVESITQLPSKETSDRPLPVNAWSNVGIVLLISIAAGVLLGGLTWLLAWLRSRSIPLGLSRRPSSTK
jgi:hypothetical protein